jgi:hypothetical protein
MLSGAARSFGLPEVWGCQYLATQGGGREIHIFLQWMKAAVKRSLFFLRKREGQGIFR